MYTIGEFSKLSHVSARMLRHYDELGLIHPDSIGTDNGYRYYDLAQLSHIVKIQELQSYGVKLKDIPNVISMSQSERQHYLTVLYHDLLQEQLKLNQTIHRLQNKLTKTEAEPMNQSKVIVIDNPKQYVFGLKRTININESEIQSLFKDLYTEAGKRNIHRTGAAQLTYLSQEFSHENMQVEAQIQVSEDTPDAHTIPACSMISAMHFGNHETLNEAYEAVCNYLSEHPEYHPAGPVMERFLQDDHEAGQFQTAVLFPVVKVI